MGAARYLLEMQPTSKETAQNSRATSRMRCSDRAEESNSLFISPCPKLQGFPNLGCAGPVRESRTQYANLNSKHHQDSSRGFRKFDFCLSPILVIINEMVPRVGIEPTRLSAADFESAASANSATRAMIGGGSDRKAGLEASPLVGRMRAVDTGLHSNLLIEGCPTVPRIAIHP